MLSRIEHDVGNMKMMLAIHGLLDSTSVPLLKE